MRSIRGFWEAIARLAHFAWSPQWWRYSYNGMPFEFSYAPGVPALIAILSHVTGWSVGRAFGVVAGFTFCIGPVCLFALAYVLTQQRWSSFIAALAYSLLAPSQLVVPDRDFRWANVLEPRRFTLIFEWDEVPHQLAVAFVLVAVLFAVCAFRGHRLCYWLSGSCIALAMLVSVFGGVVGTLFLFILWLSWDADSKPLHLYALMVTGIGVYLAICPFYPPELIHIIRQNANLSSTYGWTIASFTVLSGMLACATGIDLFLRRWFGFSLRFCILLAFVFFAIPFLGRWNLHFVPQPERYKVELEVAMSLVGVFTAAQVLSKLPNRWRVTIAVIILAPALAVIHSQRMYAKAILSPSNIRNTIEYRVANWVAQNRPGERIMAPGTIGVWMNSFTQQEQFTGGSFTTIPTLGLQTAAWGVLHLGTSAELAGVAVTWLQAYGVDLLVVPGQQSPEFWKPYDDPAQFETLLPLLWRDEDTAIYAVPRTHRSIASVIPKDRLVKKPPMSFLDAHDLHQYVSAMEQPEATAQWKWLDDRAGIIHSSVPINAAVSLHISYDSGWKAFANGEPAQVGSDGLEQLVIFPNCNGPCEIQMKYYGSLQARLTRIVSILAIVLAIAAAIVELRSNHIP